MEWWGRRREAPLVPWVARVHYNSTDPFSVHTPCRTSTPYSVTTCATKGTLLLSMKPVMTSGAILVPCLLV